MTSRFHSPATAVFTNKGADIDGLSEVICSPKYLAP